MGMFVNNVRDIGQCRVIIIINIIIITLFTVMKSGPLLLGLAKYIYYNLSFTLAWHLVCWVFFLCRVFESLR